MTFNKVVGKTSRAVHFSKRKAIGLTRTVSKSHLLRSHKAWLGTAIATVAVVFWLVPAFAGAAPGKLGYSIKRGEESVASSLAPLSSWRSSLRLDFANNRVSEAAYVANQANENGDKNQAKTAKTINNLLGAYENTYEARTAALNQDLENGIKVSKSHATEAQKDAVTTYTTLESLLLQAPDASQLSVLTAIDDTQQNIATLNDVLGSVPLSASDFSQLAKLVSSGVVPQADVNQLASAKSSRQVHAQVVQFVESGDVPSYLSYIV